MSNTIIGKLTHILPNQDGESSRGHWVRGGFVIETDEEYPRSVAFSTFGEDRVARVKATPIGQKIQVTFNPESREYQERWYTDLRCIKIENVEQV